MESSVENPSLMVGYSIIGLLALRSNHTYVPKFYLEENEEREKITPQFYHDKHNSRCDRYHIIRLPEPTSISINTSRKDGRFYREQTKTMERFMW